MSRKPVTHRTRGRTDDDSGLVVDRPAMGHSTNMSLRGEVDDGLVDDLLGDVGRGHLDLGDLGQRVERTALVCLRRRGARSGRTTRVTIAGGCLAAVGTGMASARCRWGDRQDVGKAGGTLIGFRLLRPPEKVSTYLVELRTLGFLPDSARRSNSRATDGFTDADAIG